jgi:hypothetical protein
VSEEIDEVQELLAQAAALVGDPDPEREHVACPDCTTPQVALTPRDEDTPLLAVRHDDGCPWFAARSEEERHVVAESLTIVHVGTAEARTDPIQHTEEI